VGLRAGQDTVRKISPPPEFDPRTVQPVGSSYTYYLNRPLTSAVKGIKVGKLRWLEHVFGLQEIDPCIEITVLKPEDTRRVGKSNEVA
jgi:hypothetical protein